jgi:hypothetical protein
LFCRFWEELVKTHDFERWEELASLALGIAKAWVPSAGRILELILPEMVATASTLVDEAAFEDLTRAALGIVCVAGPQVAAIPEAVATLWHCFVSPRESPESIDSYQLAMIIGQLMEFRCLATEDATAAFDRGCAMLANTDPVTEPTAVNAALKLIIPAYFIGLNVDVFAAVPDFPDRIAAFLRTGGLFADHNRLLMQKWIAFLPQQPVVLELAAQLTESLTVQESRYHHTSLDRVRDFVGWSLLPPTVAD